MQPKPQGSVLQHPTNFEPPAHERQAAEFALGQLNLDIALAAAGAVLLTELTAKRC